MRLKIIQTPRQRVNDQGWKTENRRHGDQWLNPDREILVAGKTGRRRDEDGRLVLLCEQYLLRKVTSPPY
jgi:hypothetical protein